MMVDLTTLANQLAEQGSSADSSFIFEVSPIPGEVEVLQILVEDREELPIFVSASDAQILCIAYLFKEDEVKEDERIVMNHAMLAANISIPLSSFAKIDDQYVIYGALSVNSSLDDIVHELDTLASNAVDALDSMRTHLQ
ncbi:MAG: DUF2170 family protein [Mariprofundaceae bacterium]|nr:DUF2170 family protein [Mariprofundaceae bacterium]